MQLFMSWEDKKNYKVIFGSKLQSSSRILPFGSTYFTEFLLD